MTVSISFPVAAPVPLPAGVWLLLSALGGLGFAGWRRRKAVAAWHQTISGLQLWRAFPLGSACFALRSYPGR